MSVGVNSSALSRAAIASLETSSNKLGLSKSNPLVQGLVQNIEKTKLCAEQTYSFKNGADQISATFTKEGKLTRLEIKEQIVQTKSARALTAAIAASSVAIVGTIATVAVIRKQALITFLWSLLTLGSFLLKI